MWSLRNILSRPTRLLVYEPVVQDEKDGRSADVSHGSVNNGQRNQRERTITILRSLCWLISIYCAVFYIVLSLGQETRSFSGAVDHTIARIYRTATETWDEFRHPGNPQEVADLMTEFYGMLSRMGYYEPSMILRPPHKNPSLNRTHAIEVGYSERAIKMMEMLPYLGPQASDRDRFAWSHGIGDDQFILYGTFVDYTLDFMLDDVDPLYAVETDKDGKKKDFNEPGGKYMKPDYILLMNLGSEGDGAMMVLNTKNYKIWTIDKFNGNADPATKDIDSEFADRKEYPSLDNYPNRSARKVLRDYMNKFVALEWMPGGLSNGSWEGDEYARLYRQHGWPENFDRSAFLADRANWEEEEEKRYEAEEPLRKVDQLENQLTRLLEAINREQIKIKEIDQDKELPENQTDREQWRQEHVDAAQKWTDDIVITQEKLEAARQAAKEVDREVRILKEERVAKYGY
ncbi:hypothetical protein B0O99DRAFT_628459 [Bisporella sp. PMI_857]|nr:hypothetical protein B0O99DRAFT_628459 [Bisporella sp. PMI_857]